MNYQKLSEEDPKPQHEAINALREIARMHGCGELMEEVNRWIITYVMVFGVRNKLSKDVLKTSGRSDMIRTCEERASLKALGDSVTQSVAEGFERDLDYAVEREYRILALKGRKP